MIAKHSQHFSYTTSELKYRGKKFHLKIFSGGRKKKYLITSILHLMFPTVNFQPSISMGIICWATLQYRTGWNRGHAGNHLFWKQIPQNLNRIFAMRAGFSCGRSRFSLWEYGHRKYLFSLQGPGLQCTTVLCISVGPRPHGLQTRVIIKISTHPC